MFRFVILATFIAVAYSQTYQRQAIITGNGAQDKGKCTIEVTVDGVAEVQLRGTSGVLHNVSGQLPQWRRFECTGPMPNRPASFKFSGIDGRGKQQLVTDPAQGGVAVVRIEDPDGGSEGYTFDVEWQGGTTSGPFDIGTFGQGQASQGQAGGMTRQGQSGGMTSADGVAACQQEILRQATQRFSSSDVYFRRTEVDNNRGNQNRIRGTIDVNRGQNRERYRFNCMVNLNNGRVRTAQIDATPAGNNVNDFGYPQNNNQAGGFASNDRAIQACQSAVNTRLSQQGYQRTGHGTIDIDDRGTPPERVYGNATVTDRNGRQQPIDFACDVNFSTGSVSSVNVIPRR